MFQQVIGILFPVFALIAVGYSVGRWLKPDFKPINRINMEAFVPALVFSSLVAMPLNTEQTPLLTASFIAVLLPGLIMLPVCRLFKLQYKSWAPPHMFRNSGNLAIPLFTYTFGDSALAPAVLLFVVSACLHISVGLALLSEGNPFKTDHQNADIHCRQQRVGFKSFWCNGLAAFVRSYGLCLVKRQCL